MFETDGVRCWHTGDDIAIVSFKSKMHAIGDDVLDGVLQAIDEAETQLRRAGDLADGAAVFGRRQSGASVAPALAAKQWDAIDGRGRRASSRRAAAALQR